jgi:uncharacterized protein
MNMPSIIDDLSNPAFLPDKTEGVKVVQTHISMVFVGDEFVYKVKKPINFGFLDFSTLEKRKYFCHEEVRLNRRLSRGIYMDVLPIHFDGSRYRLRGGEGEIVDYAVRMRRIPEDQLMKRVFERGALSEGHLQTIARVLARFHKNARRSPEIDAFGKADRFKINTDENFAQVEKYIDLTIPKSQFQALKTWTMDFYEKNGPLFEERIRSGRIRDCHGDLHMEHICLTEDLSIFDCIEFNERFRYSDTLADMAFLLMDLEVHGGDEPSRRLWGHYRRGAEEGEVDSLLTFYKVYRAFVRGKVIGFQVDDPGIGDAAKDAAVWNAGRYFELASSYIAP